MSENRREKGGEAEEYVAAHLVKKGYSILARNYTIRGGELDIVAQKGRQVLFVEVRSWNRQFWESGTPLETIHPQKIRHIIKTARHYLQTHGFVIQKSEIRFDVAGLIKNDAGGWEMDYIENAFYAE